MNRNITNFILLCCLPASPTLSAEPLKALLLAGGCCHDYAGQQRVLAEGIQARANVQVDVLWTDDKSTNPPFPLFEKPSWADGYDVIIHDECAASTDDVAIVNRILEVHKKIPAVHLHCAMHSFRTGTDLWFKHLGLTSRSHGPQEPIAIQFVDKEHPITRGMSDWTTVNEELYNNTQVFDAHPLAMGKQSYTRNGKEIVEEYIVAWTNEKQGARSFSTTIGHNTQTVADPRYLDLVTQGLLWSCDKLNSDYLKPFGGKHTIRFNEGVEEWKAKKAAEKLGTMPEDATLVKVTASSVQSKNECIHVLDGDSGTRWCASNDQYPQWLMFEFEKPQMIRSIKLIWEFPRAYQYKVEGSGDGNQWKLLLDASNNNDADPGDIPIAESPAIKFLRITGLGPQGAGWCSIREVSLKADGIKSLWPANPDKPSFEPFAVLVDPFKSRGNIEPTIQRLTPEQEAEILKDVKVADGFQATLFAAPPAVNYPVFVAAAPDGALFVSSDGNGSLGRDPQRGRVIRLRDLDGDGRADETKVFCKVDAPRGLVWDHDRLFLMHPPHLSEFIDHDNDGEADEQKVLVKNLAFGYDKRPADHTTNGVSLGVDGWLYIAGGDFGCIDAEGTDGKKLTHRGGGVIRVRPDGTGLELYSTGTRNILEVAVSPRMDLFARDNTNDGGGWDVRFHHFTGGDDHGYPRLFKNFADECIPPLADYGGGSGCGAVYIDEPGFGQWNDAPLTADWGTGGLYRHHVEPDGATFHEVEPPQPLVKMTRPTDADVDGMSRLYCASWRGATFAWAGENVGYIVCVKPKDFQAEPMPDFADLPDADLVRLFDSDSHRRRLAAQRELIRRNNPQYRRLLEQGITKRNPTRNLADHLRTDATDAERIAALAHSDPVIVHIAVRSLAARDVFQACFQSLDRGESNRKAILRALAMMHTPDVVDGLIDRYFKSSDAELRQMILAALCRLHFIEGKWNGQSWGTRPDTRGPYYQPDPWSETPKIAAMLKRELSTASPADAADLIREMNRNRIQSNEALERMISLAAESKTLIGDAVAQLATADEVPVSAVPLLIESIEYTDSTASTLAGAITAFAKLDRPDAVPAMIGALVRLDSMPDAGKEQQAGQREFLNSRKLEQQIAVIQSEAQRSDTATAIWADAALLTLASKKNVSPERQEAAKQIIEQAWGQSPRRVRLIQAAEKIRNHYLDDLILESVADPDPAVAGAAGSAAKTLKLTVRDADTTPKISTLSVESALEQVTKARGEVELGEQLFTKANCVACHTVSKDLPQKGPYLGNVAKTYKRPELAVAILQPSKTIAQGFATNSFLTVDGNLITGFVTHELSDRVTLRDNAAKELTLLKEEIEERKTLPTSVMPDGLMKDYSVHQVASILDYLQSLSDGS